MGKARQNPNLKLRHSSAPCRSQLGLSPKTPSTEIVPTLGSKVYKTMPTLGYLESFLLGFRGLEFRVEEASGFCRRVQDARVCFPFEMKQDDSWA